MNLINTILNILYPSYCYVCGELLTSQHCIIACQACWKKHFLAFEGEKCRICGHPLKALPGAGNTCKNCTLDRHYHFDTADFFGLYSGLIDIAINEIKFSKTNKLACKIGETISQHLKSFLKEHNIQVVIPVPMSREELSERGFNQCEEILKYSGVPFSRVVAKIRNTRKQSQLGMEERTKNVKNVFKVRYELKGMRVCIFDDVMTTGSTVNEIARILRESGTRYIAVYTVSRSILGGESLPE